MAGTMDSQMKDGFGNTVPSGSAGHYGSAKPPFDQPGDGRVFQQKIYDQINNGAPNSGRNTTMDQLGRMGTIADSGYAKSDDSD